MSEPKSCYHYNILCVLNSTFSETYYRTPANKIKPAYIKLETDKKLPICCNSCSSKTSHTI